MSDLTDIFGPVISSYSRAQAIEDGMLADVTETAREAGFTVPVAVTTGVWGLIQPTLGEVGYGQDINGRLWDVLYMAHHAIKRSADGTELLYDVIFQMRARQGYRSGQQKVTLKLHSGPGDSMEPVITIMLPEED